MLVLSQKEDGTLIIAGRPTMEVRALGGHPAAAGCWLLADSRLLGEGGNGECMLLCRLVLCCWQGHTAKLTIIMHLLVMPRCSDVIAVRECAGFPCSNKSYRQLLRYVSAGL